ncbi:hypothetical protein LTR56_025563 [Elasticomyces elasticus]|nr:hypothetical protein LTR56_025563 [Elasticomyces elasticus]KAK3649903.1 hypothetical protein LTR22_012779 [Elasticomyces elasticus]KAK4918146.1 hypothetical protein LTR49_014002 [Elasticomyces elasticus]KAK5757692.1 hypothetical protein LTS12_012151 [Elasticomyces elasticus]
MPFGESAKNQNLLLALPSVAACSTLVGTYFRSFASLFHILHDPTFHEQYASFTEDPDSMPLAWLALLYAVLATASLALSTESDLLADLSRKKSASGRILELSQRYRDMSMKCLEADHYLWNHNVTTLQALIILVYGIGHSYGPTWTLLGLAHHMAIGIGCHVDPSILNLGRIESEERRRCWAGLMMLYTNQNAVLGHVGLPHTALHANSQPPADVDDDELLEGPLNIQPARGQATQMTYLLLKFRLYDICAEICNGFLSHPDPPIDTLRRLDFALQEEQHSWEQRYMRDTESAPLPVHHLAHLNVLHSYGNHLVLLLHHQHALRARSDGFRTEWSRQRCFVSAKRILEVHSNLNTTQELATFRWYGRGLGSFHAFHAAVILVSLISGNMGDQDRAQGLEALSACASRFEDMKDLSTTSAQAAPILRTLISRLSWASQTGSSKANQFSNGEPASCANHLLTPEEHRDSGYIQQQWNGDFQLNDEDWIALLDQVAPQQWLTPSSIPWDHWQSSLMAVSG